MLFLSVIPLSLFFEPRGTVGHSLNGRSARRISFGLVLGGPRAKFALQFCSFSEDEHAFETIAELMWGLLLGNDGLF